MTKTTGGNHGQAKSLQDKFIIVTGAGRGIGREIALLCAAEGAKVVVNDPGGAADGSGSSAAPAEEVVEEIKKRGGTAVANFETVAEAIPASKIVKTAVDSFGKLDGVVNNAGILRDAIFHRMSIDAFESVIKVHLMGSFYVSHAAARLFREQESGAFVHFTSTSGLVGNFGQANYAAAKLGIVGLSKSIALDMKPLQCALQLRLAVRLEPADRNHPDRDRSREGARRKDQADGPGKDRAGLRPSAQRRRQGRHRADFWVRMNEIFLMSQSPPAALGAARRRLDAADHRRARHAGAEVVVLQARPLGGYFQLGCDLVTTRVANHGADASLLRKRCSSDAPLAMSALSFSGQAFQSCSRYPSPVVSQNSRPLYAGLRAHDFLPTKKHREEIMTSLLTFPDNEDDGAPANVDRRTLLKGAATIAATTAARYRKPPPAISAAMPSRSVIPIPISS